MILQGTWPCDLGLPPLPPAGISPVRTYQPTTLLRQHSREQPQTTSMQPIRAQMIMTHHQPVRAQIINNRHHSQRSSLLDDTIPQLKSLQLSPVSSSSYTDYENYFYI